MKSSKPELDAKKRKPAYRNFLGSYKIPKLSTSSDGKAETLPLNTEADSNQVKTSNDDSEFAMSNDSSEDELDDIDISSLMSSLNRPIPRTPERVRSVPDDVLLPVVNVTGFSPRKTESYKYNLDDLLEEKHRAEVVNDRITMMELELMDDANKGGILNMTTNFEHASQISVGRTETKNDSIFSRLSQGKEHIRDIPRGRFVFDTKQAFQKYSGESLKISDGVFLLNLNNANFVSSTRDLGLMHLPALGDDSSSNISAIAVWLLKLVSVHQNIMLVNGATTYLQYIAHIHNQRNLLPPFIELCDIFANLGVSGRRLTSDATFLNFWEEEFSLYHTTEENSVDASVSIDELSEVEQLPFHFNLHKLLQVMTVFLPEVSYATKEKLFLAVLLCGISLDYRIITSLCGDIQDCLGVLIDTFPAEEWQTVICELASHLAAITGEHSEQVHLVHLCPATPRGIRLQETLSYTFLQSMFKLQPQYLPEITAKDLAQLLCQNSKQNLLGNMTIARESSKYYYLYSAIQLMDMCIGAIPQRKEDKPDLETCIHVLKSEYLPAIRENARFLDPTRVKDLIITVTSRWQIVSQSIVSEVSSIFEHQVRTPLKIERLVPSQNTADEATELESSLPGSRSYSDDESGKCVPELSRDETTTVERKLERNSSPARSIVSDLTGRLEETTCTVESDIESNAKLLGCHGLEKSGQNSAVCADVNSNSSTSASSKMDEKRTQDDGVKSSFSVIQETASSKELNTPHLPSVTRDQDDCMSSKSEVTTLPLEHHLCRLETNTSHKDDGRSNVLKNSSISLERNSGVIRTISFNSLAATNPSAVSLESAETSNDSAAGSIDTDELIDEIDRCIS